MDREQLAVVVACPQGLHVWDAGHVAWQGVDPFTHPRLRLASAPGEQSHELRYVYAPFYVIDCSHLPVGVGGQQGVDGY